MSEQSAPRIDRGDAVNLASNVMGHKGARVTADGVITLCDAVLRMDEGIRNLEREAAALREQNAAIMEGQEMLKKQTVRIRRGALGLHADEPDTAPDTDTEDIVRNLREQLAEAEKREKSMYEKHIATKEFYSNQLAAERRRVVEECAKVADGYWSRANALNESKLAGRIAREIRALADPQQTEKEPK